MLNWPQEQALYYWQKVGRVAKVVKSCKTRREGILLHVRLFYFRLTTLIFCLLVPFSFTLVQTAIECYREEEKDEAHEAWAEARGDGKVLFDNTMQLDITFDHLLYNAVISRQEMWTKATLQRLIPLRKAKSRFIKRNQMVMIAQSEFFVGQVC